MSRLIILFTILALTGCATTRVPGDSRSRLVGTWLMIEGDVEFPTACASGLPIIYHADGTLTLFGERGTWRLDRDILTETITEAGEHSEFERSEIGRPHVARIAWRGRDRFRKLYADGAVESFRRCPPAE